MLADSYTCNALNPYTARENATLAVSGTASNSATKVAARVIGQSYVDADRASGYWRAAVVANNDQQATTDQVEVIAADLHQGTVGDPHTVRKDTTRTATVPGFNQRFIYDLDGNLLDDGLWVYTWNEENRLIAMETASPAYQFGGVARVKLTFLYDYLHRRVQKQRFAWTSGAWVAQSDRRFTYEGWNLIREDEWMANTARTYTWGLDVVGGLQGSAGVGALIALHDAIDNPAGKLLLPGYDANGNVAVMVNAANGDLEAAYEYGPFGEMLRAEGTSAKINPVRFSTKYADDETGLVYYGRRYYDPRNGRFLGRDPLGEKGGINLYAFVANNTINRWDYLGMEDLVNNFNRWRRSADSPYDRVTANMGLILPKAGAINKVSYNKNTNTITLTDESGNSVTVSASAAALGSADAIVGGGLTRTLVESEISNAFSPVSLDSIQPVDIHINNRGQSNNARTGSTQAPAVNVTVNVGHGSTGNWDAFNDLVENGINGGENEVNLVCFVGCGMDYYNNNIPTENQIPGGVSSMGGTPIDMTDPRDFQAIQAAGIPESVYSDPSFGMIGQPELIDFLVTLPNIQQGLVDHYPGSVINVDIVETGENTPSMRDVEQRYRDLSRTYYGEDYGPPLIGTRHVYDPETGEWKQSGNGGG